jgi:hypothetical protein
VNSPDTPVGGGVVGGGLVGGGVVVLVEELPGELLDALSRDPVEQPARANNKPPTANRVQHNRLMVSLSLSAPSFAIAGPRAKPCQLQACRERDARCWTHVRLGHFSPDAP